jgi:hypothetical protein
VFDRKNCVWWRFDDHIVTKVTEDVVMHESIGGHKNSNKAAYMLIYINELIVTKCKDINLE